MRLRPPSRLAALSAAVLVAAASADGTTYHPECEPWAAAGECVTNPGYMLNNCRKDCHHAFTTNSHHDSDQCARWAAAGECASSNRPFMVLACSKSCGMQPVWNPFVRQTLGAAASPPYVAAATVGSGSAGATGHGPGSSSAPASGRSFESTAHAICRTIHADLEAIVTGRQTGGGGGCGSGGSGGGSGAALIADAHTASSEEALVLGLTQVGMHKGASTACIRRSRRCCRSAMLSLTCHYTPPPPSLPLFPSPLPPLPSSPLPSPLPSPLLPSPSLSFTGPPLRPPRL